MYLSQDQIEFVVEKTRSQLAEQLVRGEITQAQHDSELSRLQDWCRSQQVPA